MPVQNLKSQIAHLPEQPGVYLFANEDGETIYIGKARSLRDRVRSYLGARGLHPKTDALLDEAAGLEVIVTDSVVEALALENNLVKERSPRYNVRLRDDKNYPVPAADDERRVSARARRAPRRARRELLRRPVHARVARAADDGADASAFRHPLVQRGHHRQSRAALPRVRHQAMYRALRRRNLFEGAVRRGRAAYAPVLRRERTTS